MISEDRALSSKSLLSLYLFVCFILFFLWRKKTARKQVGLTFGQSACLTFRRVKSKGSGFMKTYFRLTLKLKLDLIWLEALGLNFVNNFKYLYNFRLCWNTNGSSVYRCFGFPLKWIRKYLHEVEFCGFVGLFNGQCLFDWDYLCFLFIKPILNSFTCLNIFVLRPRWRFYI